LYRYVVKHIATSPASAADAGGDGAILVFLTVGPLYKSNPVAP
jgi:hypothetical protein